SQIGSGTTIRNLGGTLDLSGRNTTITDLVLQSTVTQNARVTTGNGTLTLNGNVAVSGSPAAATTSSITGNLSLSSAAHTFAVADGAAADDLLISGNLIGGGSNQNVLTKSGTGLLALTGSNSFAGKVNVGVGILDVRNSLALGATDAPG